MTPMGLLHSRLHWRVLGAGGRAGRSPRFATTPGPDPAHNRNAALITVNTSAAVCNGDFMYKPPRNRATTRAQTSIAEQQGKN